MRLPYRSFAYTDWINEFKMHPAPMRPEYLDQVVAEVADGGMDAFVVNPNGMTTMHPSSTWETMYGRYEAGDIAGALGGIPAEERHHHELLIQEMGILARQCDCLEYVGRSCRRRGIAFGVSLRMNDVHGWEWGRSCWVSDFWYGHPELRVPGTPFLDYSHPEVRLHFLALTREVLARYAPDVLDLDFLRGPHCLPRGEEYERRGMVTELIAQVRGAIAELSPATHLLVRLPGASPQMALDQGFDVGAWASYGLIDGLLLGAHLHAAWDAPVPEFRLLVGDDVAIYPTGCYFADTREGLPERLLAQEAELMRGFAAGHLANGADGIYWFNFLVVRQQRCVGLADKIPPGDFEACRPLCEVAGECADLATLMGKPKTYLLYNATQHTSDLDPLSRPPTNLAPGEVRSFSILLAAEPAAAHAELVLVYRSAAQDATLWLEGFNILEPGLRGDPRDGPASARTVVFKLASRWLRNGANNVHIRNGDASTRLVSLEVRVN